MRWVDRGPEPDGVAGYAQRFTPGWVDYFQNGVGERPRDSRWGEFRSALGGRTNNICWYCERECYPELRDHFRSPTVDHFRPISRFPQLAYAWANWIFSCQRCNGENKKDNWPETGYVDPCAAAVAERPEEYFDYDVATGKIEARNGLSEAAKNKADTTIYDLGLNDRDLADQRFARMERLRSVLPKLPTSEHQAAIASFVEEYRGEYAGVTGMVVEQLRRDGRI